MKFGAHQSFYLKDQWLYKGIYWTHKHPKILLENSNAMHTLGVGKNMVEAIKFWLKASKLITDEITGFKLTQTAQTILKKDPYFELDGTLHLIHYFLTTNKEDATTWFWFFNYFLAMEFDKESLISSLSAYIKINTTKIIQDKTLEKDLSCLLKMYQKISYTQNKTPETEAPSPFAKYGWIKQEGSKYIQNKLNIYDIDIHIFSYLLYIFWKDHLKKPESIRLEDLYTKIYSPGLIFKFSQEDISEWIKFCSNNTNYLQHSRTGGYFIIRIQEAHIKQSLTNYYKKNSL